jgi:hypothetical protein
MPASMLLGAASGAADPVRSSGSAGLFLGGDFFRGLMRTFLGVWIAAS